MQSSNTDAYPTKCNTFIDLWYESRFGMKTSYERWQIK